MIGDREKIRVEYLNAGFASVQVNVAPAFSTDGTRADLPFKVDEGPQTIVDHILIVGNTRTDPAVIRRELQFREGQPLGQEALIESQRRLSALGLFRRIRIAAAPARRRRRIPTSSSPSRKRCERRSATAAALRSDQVLTRQVLKDRPQQRFEFAPRGFFEIGRRNLGGKNRSVNLYTRLSLRPNDDPDDPKILRLHRIPRRRHVPRAASACAATAT